MIVEGVLNLVKYVILGVIGLFPTFPDTSFLAVSLEPLVNVLTSVNSFISVSLLSKCLVTLLLFMNIEFIWSCVMWVVKKLPFVN